MKKVVLFTLTFMLAGVVAEEAGAHHSAAMFDMTKQITVTGTVKEWQFTSPHSWLQVIMVTRDGKQDQWAFEGGGPSGNSLRMDTFKVGEKVTVITNPMKDGRHAGLLGLVTFADGRTFDWRKPLG